MSKIDINSTKVILIGVSEFRDKCFINAGPIRNNVAKLRELLRDKDILGIDEKQILVFDENERHDEILSGIVSFLEHDFADTVIFYFAGHGFKNDQDDFYLITNNSSKQFLNNTAIPWDTIKGIFEKGSGIQQRFYILDTCHSGAAELGENDEVLDIADGSALIAAAKADSKAYFNETDQYTYFTEALINVLENGIQQIDEPELSIRPIFKQLDTILKDRKIGVTIKSTHRIESVTLFKNKSFNKAETYLKQARNFFEQGKYDEAIRQYRDAISEYVLTGNVSKKKINDIKKEIENARLHLVIQEKFLREAREKKVESTFENQFQETERNVKKDTIQDQESTPNVVSLKEVPLSIKKAANLIYVLVGVYWLTILLLSIFIYISEGIYFYYLILSLFIIYIGYKVKVGRKWAKTVFLIWAIMVSISGIVSTFLIIANAHFTSEEVFLIFSFIVQLILIAKALFLLFNKESKSWYKTLSLEAYKQDIQRTSN